jgi:threonylcarbamoyladenosine tRNA methylthiotransferase CDKAL1
MASKILIKNFGCSSNIADGEVLAGCLAKAGFQITQSENRADLIIFNTCAVKGPTENRIINQAKHAPKNKKILIAGCLPKISFQRLTNEVRFDGAVGPAFGGKIIKVVQRVFAGEKVVELDEQKKPLLGLPRQTLNPVISIVPINYGCLGNCSYCCVVHARGHLRSYSLNEIIDRVQKDNATGAKEFWLTSQDTASYGRDINTNLAELLLAVGNLKGEFFVRVGMMTPNLVLDILPKLLDSFCSDKIFKFLHLPIQSGDDSNLKSMNRFYTVQQFKTIVQSFRAKFPKLTLATDVIVGFPGETTEAFQNTLKLLEEIQPDVVNVSKFFARPKTVAWEMKEGLVEKEETKKRSTLTSELAKGLSARQNQRWAGWSGKVLVDERGKVEGSWVGRNFAYKPIVIQAKDELLGKTVEVKVNEVAGTYMKGEPLEF